MAGPLHAHVAAVRPPLYPHPHFLHHHHHQHAKHHPTTPPRHYPPGSTLRLKAAAALLPPSSTPTPTDPFAPTWYPGKPTYRPVEAVESRLQMQRLQQEQQPPPRPQAPKARGFRRECGREAVTLPRREVEVEVQREDKEDKEDEEDRETELRREFGYLKGVTLLGREGEVVTLPRREDGEVEVEVRREGEDKEDKEDGEDEEDGETELGREFGYLKGVTLLRQEGEDGEAVTLPRREVEVEVRREDEEDEEDVQTELGREFGYLRGVISLGRVG